MTLNALSLLSMSAFRFQQLSNQKRMRWSPDSLKKMNKTAPPSFYLPEPPPQLSSARLPTLPLLGVFPAARLKPPLRGFRFVSQCGDAYAVSNAIFSKKRALT